MPLCRLEQRELAARQELPDVSIEADEVFTEVRDGRRQPGIRHIVFAQLLVEAPLSQLQPLRARRRELHTRRGQERIDERHRVFDRCGIGRVRLVRCCAPASALASASS